MLGEILERFAKEGITKTAKKVAKPTLEALTPSVAKVAEAPVKKTVWHGGPENLYDVGIKTLDESLRKGTGGAMEGAGFYAGESHKVGEYYAEMAKKQHRSDFALVQQDVLKHAQKNVLEFQQVAPSDVFTGVNEVTYRLSKVADEEAVVHLERLLAGIESRYKGEPQLPRSATFAKALYTQLLKSGDYKKFTAREESAYLHKINLPVDKMNWLDWDKEVPKELRKDLSEKLMSKSIMQEHMINTKLTGKDFYQNVSDRLGSKEKASKFLDEQGIHGMKYPAADPKTGERYKGPRLNYVIYNPKKWISKEDIERIGVYGLTGLAVGANFLGKKESN